MSQYWKHCVISSYNCLIWMEVKKNQGLPLVTKTATLFLLDPSLVG